MAGPAVLVATSTSYAVWTRPSVWAYAQVAVGVIVLMMPEGAVTLTFGTAGMMKNGCSDQSPQCCGWGAG